MKCDLYFENIEGNHSFNIPRDFWLNRKPGLSAMVRVKNEGQFLLYSVASIIDWHDEVWIFIQGHQEDDTEAVAQLCQSKWPDKVRIAYYPFESYRNGPGHENQPRGSLNERAYFYNWCLAHTSHEFANKWDGDMIAHEWLGPSVRTYMNHYDGIWFKGQDLFGPRMQLESNHAYTATEQRVHRVTEKTFYFTYTHCEHFSGTRSPDHKTEKNFKFPNYGFIHLKWCKKELKFSGVGWPDDWLTADYYYREIYDRKKGTRRYRGEYPPAIRAYAESLA